MKTYSRAAFREWLTTLPKDKPVCERYQCPVSMFTGQGPVYATFQDCGLTKRIDAVCPRGNDPHGMRWICLKPDDVIAIIDELEQS